MMKRSRGETMQPKKVQEEPLTKSQRRYKSPKRPHNAPTTRTEDNNLTTVPVVVAVNSTCTEHPEMHTEVPLYTVGDELSGLWSCAVEQDELSGWYPFVDGHFWQIGEEENVDLDLWRHGDVIEVPN